MQVMLQGRCFITRQLLKLQCAVEIILCASRTEGDNKIHVLFLISDYSALDLILIVSVLFGYPSKYFMHDWFAFQVFALVWI